MLDLIKKTNGDVLGVFLFILLIIHFYYLENKTIYTNLLSISCLIALIVDFNVTIHKISQLYF